MMKDCLYTDRLSEIKLKDSAKDRILQNLYEYEQNKETVISSQTTKAQGKNKPVFKRATTWIALTASLCIVAMVAIILVSAFTVPVQDAFVINNPLKPSDRIYLESKAQNAQYLPDASILAEEAKVESSQISLSSQAEDDIVIENSDFANRSYEISDSTLRLNEEDYTAVIRGLATNDYQSDSVWTVENIKQEVLFVMSIIPGYDQWFWLNGGTSYVENWENYRLATFKLNYDEKNDVITMTRISWFSTVDIYDSTERRLYSTAIESNCYSRAILEVKYYKDEQGKDTVECKNTRYYYLNGKYYPVSVDVIKNTADTCATKLSVYFTFDKDLKEPYYFDEEHRYFTYDTYDLNDINEYGALVRFTQLDYSENDISILRVDKLLPSLYSGIVSPTNITLYQKSGEDMMYYVGAWDYYDWESSEGYVGLRNTYAVSSFMSYEEGRPVYLCPSEKSIKESITKYAYCYHLDEMLCKSCYGYPYSDFIGTCPHLKASENITRASVVKLYNTGSVFGKADDEKKEISSQLEKFYKDINGSEKEFGGWSSDRLSFESAVDSYLGETVRCYVDNRFDIEDIAKIEKEGDSQKEEINEDRLKQILQEKVLGVESTESNTYSKDGKVYCNFSVELTGAQVDTDKEYYLAVFVEESDKFESHIGVLLKKKIEIPVDGERVYSIKGEFSYEDIVNMAYYDPQEGYNFGNVLFGIISYDAEGFAVKETVSSTLKTNGDNAKYVGSYLKDGEKVWYSIRSNYSVYYRLTEY